jgi:hypothetical protein
VQHRVPVVHRDPSNAIDPPAETKATKKKRKPRKAAGGATGKPTPGLPPRFRGTPVPISIRITRIWVKDVVPGLPGTFSGVCNLNCDLVITVAGKRVLGLSNDEFAESGDVSLNEWLNRLFRLRIFLHLERRFDIRGTGHQLGLVFERKAKLVAFSVHDSYARAAVPGFERLVLDLDALVGELHAFVAAAKALVLEGAPNHATADSWWRWNTAQSIDTPDDA